MAADPEALTSEIEEVAVSRTDVICPMTGVRLVVVVRPPKPPVEYMVLAADYHVVPYLLTEERENGAQQARNEIEKAAQEVLTLYSGRGSGNCEEPNEGNEERSEAGELHGDYLVSDCLADWSFECCLRLLICCHSSIYVAHVLYHTEVFLSSMHGPCSGRCTKHI